MKTLLLKHFVVFLLLFTSGSWAFAQMSISPNGSIPDNSAMLDVKSTTKGMLLPRMTQSQIEAIASPANGLVVFCTTDNKFYVYIANAGTWKEILLGTGTIPWTCSSPITRSHMTAGGVAPVNKVVTYGTITNIQGELSKCWITSNLGADHQATAVDDATEASAGWYWQFNNKQGYKHDGSTRTPNTGWICSIAENSDWIAGYDHCALELGSGWRIPTYTEWYNVNTNGGWTNWNIIWNSGLKIHAAGNLICSGGSLGSRGSQGFYWSSMQASSLYGYFLGFSSNYSIITSLDKGEGFSLRCIKN